MNLQILIPFMGFLGAIVGSFLAATSVRLPRNESIAHGRSHCMTCDRSLASHHLIPIVSWVVLRGRCGWCRGPISPRYILIEGASALIGVWSAFHGETGLMVVATAVLGWQLLLIATVDAENFWLPDILTIPLILIGLMFAFSGHGFEWSRLIGATVGFTVLWALALAYRFARGRDGLGGGDPILLAGAGAWVGWIGLPTVLLWASAVGLSLLSARLLTRRPVRGGDRVPFGTYLAMGIWLTWLYGPLGL